MGRSTHERVTELVDRTNAYFGSRVLFRLGDFSEPSRVAVSSTGSILFDHALGVGGIPRGAIVELRGSSGFVGKTFAYHAVAHTQQRGKLAAFVDCGHNLDPHHAQRLDVDLRQLLVAQPDTPAQALEIVEALLRSATPDLVVLNEPWRSDALPDDVEYLKARAVATALRRFTALCYNGHQTVLVLLTHPEVLRRETEATPDAALRFYASIRVRLDQADDLAIVRVVKNRLALPFRRATVMTTPSGVPAHLELLSTGRGVGLPPDGHDDWTAEDWSRYTISVVQRLVELDPSWRWAELNRDRVVRTVQDARVRFA